MEQLTFRGLSFASDTEIDLILDADDGTIVTWRFTRSEHAGIGVINGPDEFTETYRQVPGPSFAEWPERIVQVALDARRQPFPAGEAAHRVIAEAREDIARRWSAEDRTD
jgi:hypothetical protein